MKIVVKKIGSLSSAQIKKICILKDTHWKFGKKKQLLWFKKNVKKNDFHFIVSNKKNIVGYTLLRLREFNYSILKSKRKTKLSSKYFLFDTHIVKSSFRGKGVNNILMRKISIFLKKSNKIGFLLCSKKLIRYYKKFGWVLVKKDKVKINNLKTNKFFMIFNSNKIFSNLKLFNFYFYFK